MKQPIVMLILLTLVLTAHAESYVAINSMDGRDVLSGVYYANVVGLPVKFMPVPGGNPDVFATKIGSNQQILLIQGTVPVSGFVESALESKNNTVETYVSSDGGATNLDLAKRSGADTFIVVDSAYSDGALSVLPYAAKKKAYVLLANKDNAADIKTIVSGKRVMIYGLVDSAVSAELASLNPEYIGNGEDKYEDNIIIAEKFMDEFGINYGIMSDGSFIEESIAKGDQPIILTGRLVPQVTYDFIRDRVDEGEFSGVMLIGNELVVPIYDMRERMKKEFLAEGENKTFGITVKFAQVVPSAGSSVLTLDTFALPAYQPSVNITDVVFNSNSGNVMVSVDNTGEGSAYYTLELRVLVDGADYKVYTSNETMLIERGQQLGSEFPLDLSGVSEGNVTAVALAKYGSSKKSLEEYTTLQGPLTSITYTDTSNVSVQSAKYSKDKGTLLVSIKNNGAEKAYVFSKLSLIIGGSTTSVSAPDTREIEPGSLIVEEFPLALSDEDIKSNQNISVYVDYGARQGFLTKKAQYIVPLEGGGADILIFVVAGVALLLALAVVAALAYYLFGRGKNAKKKG